MVFPPPFRFSLRLAPYIPERTRLTASELAPPRLLSGLHGLILSQIFEKHHYYSSGERDYSWGRGCSWGAVSYFGLIHNFADFSRNPMGNSTAIINKINLAAEVDWFFCPYGSRNKDPSSAINGILAYLGVGFWPLFRPKTGILHIWGYSKTSKNYGTCVKNCICNRNRQ